MSRNVDQRLPLKPSAYTDMKIRYSGRGRGKRFLPLLSDEDRALVEDRPRTRGECKSEPRPCVRITCRYNLWLNVSRRGTVKFNHPDLEPDEMPAGWSCALDVADRGTNSLLAVGRALNIVRERVRQIEKKALKRLEMSAEYLKAENLR